MFANLPVGSVIAAPNQRKGTIIDTEVRDDEFTLTVEVASNDMFGYSSQLREVTQSKGKSRTMMEWIRAEGSSQVKSRWSTR